MTRVLPLGYGRIPVRDDRDVAHATLARDDLPDLAELIGGSVGLEERVVAIHPSWWSGDARLRLETLRAAFDTTRFTLYASDLPPLAGAVLLGLATAVADALPPERSLVDVLPRLERAFVAVTRLRSVARLERPSPSMLQHVQSWWPPSRFAVHDWPETGVHRLLPGDRRLIRDLAYWQGAPLDHVAVCHGEEADHAWFRDDFLPRMRSPEVVEVEPGETSARYWHSKRVVELVLFPGSVPAVVEQLDEVAIGLSCHWCGETTAHDPCPYCRTSREPAVPRPVEQQPPPPAPSPDNQRDEEMAR